MKLIIGCPIYKRDWILPLWIRCILKQSLDISNIGFVFETSPDDIATVKALHAWKKIDPRIPLFIINERKDINHYEHKNNGRQWTLSKYHNMISLRNSLLRTVRGYQPDYYFSLDSDVLVQNPNTLELLIAHVKAGADAVSPLMYMTPVGVQFPSVMSWKNEVGAIAYRENSYPLGSFFRSDIIMAAKMMSKDVYNQVDYVFHQQGEDLGWSANATQNGFSLFCASYIYAPHIMSPVHFEEYKQNGDKRSSEILENLVKV